MSAKVAAEEAFDLVNRSDYGPQAGVFTRDLQTAFAAGRKRDVGGVKGSGIGREELRPRWQDHDRLRCDVFAVLKIDNSKNVAP